MSKKPIIFNDFLKKEIKLKNNPITNKEIHEDKKGLFRRILDKELHNHPFAIPVITFAILSFVTMISFVLISSKPIGNNDSYVVQISVENKKIIIPSRALNVKDLLERNKIKLKEGDIVEPSTDTAIDADDFRVNVYRAKPVTIIDGNKRIQALSAATTPRAIAAQAGIQVYAEDKIIQANPRDVLKDNVLGAELVIERSTPVNLNLYGTQVTIRTHADTVEELLKEKNVILVGTDTVLPSSKTAITDGIQIFITRVGTKIETATEEIPNENQILEDQSLSFGTSALRQAGSPGRKLVTYQIDTENGVEIGRKIIQEVTVQEPVPRITARGKAVSIPADKTAWMVAAGLKPNDYPYANYIISHESGWCPTKWQGQIGYCPPYYEPIHSIDSGFGYGLCQSTPAKKMASAGSDWQTSAITQLKWCSGYAQGRYGSWEAAYNFWIAKKWW